MFKTRKKRTEAPAKTHISPQSQEANPPLSMEDDTTDGARNESRPWRFFAKDAEAAWESEKDMILKGWEEAKKAYGGEPIEVIYMAGYIQRGIDAEGLDR